MHRGVDGTKPGSLLRTQIPLQGAVWDERRVGFLEADSVAHCGDSLAGNFVWSLTYTDLASTWTEGRAVWNKGAAGVLAQTQDVEACLPFALLGFDFDNGSEWLNWHLIRHLQAHRQPVQISRSRPYHKDDNAHVEQKNWMWPRHLLGYGRLGQERVVTPINTLYKQVWGPLHNFFLPSMKLRDKWREGSRWVRRHDPAQTAYQRLLASGPNQSSPATTVARVLRVLGSVCAGAAPGATTQPDPAPRDLTRPHRPPRLPPRSGRAQQQHLKTDWNEPPTSRTIYRHPGVISF